MTMATAPEPATELAATRPGRLRAVLRRLFGGGLGLLALVQSGCFTVRYIGQQAWGQLALLRARRPVSEVIADPATAPELRARLRLAMQARQFGVEVLGLRGGAEFTRYVEPLEPGGPIAYNLTAADKTALTVRRWRFPLVGSVPYLGFFQRLDAETEARKLQARGYDVYLRPVSGYSTLGYFISPIYASMVDGVGPEAEVRTVEVILHEMAHSTAYVKSASELNESYATLVGVQGAARFFRERGQELKSRKVLELAEAQRQRGLAFATWLESALAKLRAFYEAARAQGLSREETIQRRDAQFAALIESYRTAFPSGPRYRRLAEGPINNAVLVSLGVYHESSSIQEDLLDAVDGDLSRFIALYKQAQDRPDGAAWLERLAAAHRKTLPLDARRSPAPR